MLFMLLIALPITIVIWLALRLLGRRVNFEGLHVGVGVVIIGVWLAVIFGCLLIGTIIGIWRHLWVLLIAMPLIVGISIYDAKQTRARLRQRDS